MNTMDIKKKNKMESINFRCDSELKKSLDEQSNLLGVKPAELIRYLLDKELKKLKKKNSKLNKEIKNEI